MYYYSHFIVLQYYFGTKHDIFLIGRSMDRILAGGYN
jgi:hypothetical protein